MQFLEFDVWSIHTVAFLPVFNRFCCCFRLSLRWHSCYRILYLVFLSVSLESLNRCIDAVRIPDKSSSQTLHRPLRRFLGFEVFSCSSKLLFLYFFFHFRLMVSAFDIPRNSWYFLPHVFWDFPNLFVLLLPFFLYFPLFHYQYGTFVNRNFQSYILIYYIFL